MNTIKIISNPYVKNIKFQILDNETNEWLDITEETNPQSNLLKVELIKDFFPFKVSDILKYIIKEFEDEEQKVKVVFSGTDDEYDELVECSKGKSFVDKVIVDRDNFYIENARDVLPRIISVFKNINELIANTEIDKSELQVDLKKFTEASDDLIPLCVMGNYSSGKSTFINALIGSEVLPNGDAPVTAKIYKITPSKDNDRAKIRFGYDGDDVELVFTNSGLLHDTVNKSNELVDLILQDINSISEDKMSIYELVTTALRTINEPYNEDDELLDEYISDIIEVEIPFKGGILGNGKHRYAIFDTPGSNSASNYNHLEVLKKAMSNMSNGLPIFVSEFKSLDSMDNENLYNLIKELKELDDRFTMIVVNKADEASLPTDMIDGKLSPRAKNSILRQYIPKKLYSGGIYFVSSIIGLGAKNDGKFSNINYAEKFVEKKQRFSDPNYEFYKSLYQYNITPDHLRKRMLESAKNSSNLLLANSGVYSVEEKIEVFAGKYSAYDKCYQSELFLSRVQEQTEKEIDISKVDLEDYREKLNDDLEEGKKRLIDALESTNSSLKNQFYLDIPKFGPGSYEGITFTKQSLDKYYETVINNQRDEQNLDEYQKNSSDDFKTLKNNVVSNVEKAFRYRTLDSLIKVKEQFVEDYKKNRDDQKKINDVEKSIDEESAKDLIDSIKKLFTNHVSVKQEEFDENSKSYWGHNGAILKDKLTNIVKGDVSLSDEEREKLIDLILSYDNITFDNKAEQIFTTANFEYRLFGMKELKYYSKLNTNRIASIYNGEIKDALKQIFETVEQTHRANFETWSNELLNTLRANIVEFNPELHRTANNIAKQTRKIESLEESKQMLKVYMQEIQSMLDWKKFN